MNGTTGNEVGGPGPGWRHELVGGRGATRATHVGSQTWGWTGNDGGRTGNERRGWRPQVGGYVRCGGGRQNEWEDQRQGRAGCSYLARVKHERGEGSEWAHLQFEIVIVVRLHLSIPLGLACTCPHPFTPCPTPSSMTAVHTLVRFVGMLWCVGE